MFFFAPVAIQVDSKQLTKALINRTLEVENNKVARALNVASAADVRLEIKPMILFSLFNLVFIVMHLSKVSMVKCSNG